MSRTWTSSDGVYQVEATLVEAQREHVVLRKADGRRITVPKNRLGAADLAYLRRITGAVKEPVPDQDTAAVNDEIAAILTMPQPTAMHRMLVLPAQGSHIENLDFSADGLFLLSQNRNGELFVWDAEHGKQVAKLERACKGNRSTFSPDGRYVVVVDGETDLHVFDAQTGKLLRTHKADAPVFRFAVSADSSRLAAADNDGRIYRFALLEEDRTVHQLEKADRVLVFFASRRGDYVIFNTALNREFRVLKFGVDGKGVESVLSDFAGCAVATTPTRFIVGFDENEYKIAPAIRFGADQRVEPFTRLIRSNSQVTSVEHILVDKDERYFALLNAGRGRIAVGDLEFPHLLTRFPLAMPRDGVGRRAFSANGRMSAFSHRDHTISMWRLPAFVGSPELRIAQTAHAWLADKQYDKLEALGAWLREHPGVVPYASGAKQYGILVEHLGKAPFSERLHTQHMLDWFEARPQSALARICLAQTHTTIAWLARGSGYANTVSALGAQVMHQNMQAAHEKIMPIIEGRDPPPAAFSILFSVATAESWSQDKTQPYVEQLLAIDPAYYPANHQLSIKLLPRWGGEQGDTERFARTVADKIGGADGDGAYALIAAGLHPFFSTDSFLNATGFDYERVMRGLMHVADREPKNVYPLDEALVFATLENDIPKMQEAFEKIVKAGGFWISDTGLFHSLHQEAFWMATRKFQPGLDQVTPEPDPAQVNAPPAATDDANNTPRSTPATPIPVKPVSPTPDTRPADPRPVTNPAPSPAPVNGPGMTPLPTEAVDPASTTVTWREYAQFPAWSASNFGMADDGTLAIGDIGKVHLYNPLTGKRSQTLPGPESVVYRFAFAKGGDVFCGLEGHDKRRFLHVWDARSGAELSSLELTALGEDLGDASVSGDVAVFDYGAARLFALPNLDQRRDLDVGDARRVVRSAFSPDGKLFACHVLSSARTEDIYLYDAASGKQTKVFPGGGAIWQFSSDGKSLYVWHDGEAKRLNLVTGRHQRPVSQPIPRGWCLSVDRRDLLMATGDDKGTVRLWNLKTRRQIAEFSAYDRPVRNILFVEGGRGLATCSVDRPIKLWAATKDR
ncbi:MAG: SHD1 domain-containing protein [Pirellulaceae bacterium]